MAASEKGEGLGIAAAGRRKQSQRAPERMINAILQADVQCQTRAFTLNGSRGTTWGALGRATLPLCQEVTRVRSGRTGEQGTAVESSGSSGDPSGVHVGPEQGWHPGRVPRGEPLAFAAQFAGRRFLQASQVAQ